jgi:hypothetical protein
VAVAAAEVVAEELRGVISLIQVGVAAAEVEAKQD